MNEFIFARLLFVSDRQGKRNVASAAGTNASQRASEWPIHDQQDQGARFIHLGAEPRRATSHYLGRTSRPKTRHDEAPFCCVVSVHSVHHQLTIIIRWLQAPESRFRFGSTLRLRWRLASKVKKRRQQQASEWTLVLVAFAQCSPVGSKLIIKRQRLFSHCCATRGLPLISRAQGQPPRRGNVGAIFPCAKSDSHQRNAALEAAPMRISGECRLGFGATLTKEASRVRRTRCGSNFLAETRTLETLECEEFIYQAAPSIRDNGFRIMIMIRTPNKQTNKHRASKSRIVTSTKDPACGFSPGNL